MKEQFLNLSGLTEVVDYIKKYVDGKKEILPYASKSLFPPVGDINTIYIDTATNTIYRWDNSNKNYVVLAQAVKSVGVSESTENGKITLTVDGNKTDVSVHGLGSAAYTDSNAYAPMDHTHTKDEIGLGNVDNTADVDKSVKHATSADKLQASRKIGNASFDGTTDITLTQMGINNPIEVTRAEYDQLSKAGEIDDNAYYNILDDYDAALIINDSSLSLNQTFSSNKIDEIYSKKSIKTITKLSKSKWVGTSSPYKYLLSVPGATDSNTIEISCVTGVSSDIINTYCNSGFQDGGQSEDQIIITAKRKPTIDIPITVMVRNDL